MNIKNIILNIINFIKHLGIKRVLLVLLIIVAILGVGGSYYFYTKYQEIAINPNVETKKETDALVRVVGKIIELPKDEIPTVATISDKEKLAGQPFFVMGENGDKLLAYNLSKIAVLYRPSTNKIINVAPITVNQPDASAQNMQHGAIGHLHRIAYYNGTETVGLAYLAEKKVKQKYSDYKTVAVANAVKKDYEGVLVIDLVGDHGEEVRALATLFGGTVGNLPAGEVAPEADILVISGK